MKVWVNVPVLTFKGAVYRRGDTLEISMSSHTKWLINEGTFLTRAPKVDVQPKIVDNKPKEEPSAPPEVKHGKKRGRKSRKVRDGGSSVPEGLSGAESPDRRGGDVGQDDCVGGD